ncbi:hypothetical protein SUDANB15_00317 [Streptomyces sp. enrichment culture]
MVSVSETRAAPESFQRALGTRDLQGLLDVLAQDTGASEQQLRTLAAESLGEVCFRDGRRAHGLEAESTDVEHLEFDR